MSTVDEDKIVTEFHWIEGRNYPSLTDRKNIEYLMKWSMKGRLLTHTYSFDMNFKQYDIEKFFKKFILSKGIIQSLNGTCLSDEHLSVEFIPINCSLTDMSLFKRLKGPVVRDNYDIKQCFDDMFDGITVNDELRKALLVDDSDNFSLFNDSERDEFIFRLFKHICIGGELCQQEGNLEVYLDFTRRIYKDLITVLKDSETKKIRIISHVYEFRIKDGDYMIFPSSHEHTNTWAYAIIDPLKRNLIILSHNFGIGEF